MQVNVSYLRKDLIEIEVKNTNAREDLTGTLVNLNGVPVLTQKIKTNYRNQVDGSGLSAGVYVLGIHDKSYNLIYSKKVVLGVSGTE